MKRFVKEYAKYRIDELNGCLELATFPPTIERLTNARSEIFQLLKVCEMGLLSENETVKAICNVNF